MPLIDAVALHNEIAKDAKLTDGERDLMLDYIDSAPPVEIEQKWILITERLPEWLDYVIVHYEKGAYVETLTKHIEVNDNADD